MLLHRFRTSGSVGDHFMYRGNWKSFVEEAICEVHPERGGVMFIGGVLA